MTQTLHQPAALADFLFSSPNTHTTLKKILNGTIPFPSQGTTGILLYGTYGTGKTTLAKLIPVLIEDYYARQGQISQMNIGDFEFISCLQGLTGPALVKQINGQLDIDASHRYNSKCHYFILDEVDNLTQEAMRSLKAVMNRARGIFILTTNYITKIDQGVKDRCYVLEMGQASDNDAIPFLHRQRALCKLPPVSDSELAEIARQSKGSIRNMTRQVMTL